jgi:hypothetical protein
MEAFEAIQGGNPDALGDALDQKPCDLETLMICAILLGSLDSVKVLYDKGYEQQRSTDPDKHPALVAVNCGQLEILRFVVDRSGAPRALRRICAVKGDVEMLRYVRELGCMFDERTTKTAAGRGDLEALRYLHESGPPWDSRTLVAAVEANSLPCLEYAHVHGCPQEDNRGWRHHVLRTHSLPVLRYVCEHMDAAFASRMMEDTARALATTEDGRPCWWASLRWSEDLDWPLVLYLGRKLGAGLPEVLAKAKATRTERAAALAGVFWKARKLLCAEETRVLQSETEIGRRKISRRLHGRMALWDALARVPKELQERIAVEAHLIIL